MTTSTDELRTVRLSGELGRLFGRVHRLAIASPAEAVRALCAIRPGFERHLIESADRGVGYKVINTGEAVRELGDLHLPTGARGEVRIVPMLAGAKSAFFQIILGAALIVASGGALLGAGGALAEIGAVQIGATTIAGIVGSIGVSLVLGGVVQMLSPSPNTGVQEKPENTPSYGFNGAVNTTAQGQPVPVGYGRLIVGGAVVSAGIRVVEATTV